MSIFKNYYRLTKPGIVYGNVLHAVATGLLAWSLTKGSLWGLLWASVGLALVVASACVINCITDRHLDVKMQRTSKRPLPLKQVSVRSAAVYAALLFIAGSIVLLGLTNVTVFVAAFIGHVTYTVVYGYVKRHSWTGTMFGTVPGAMPVLVGYAAIDPALPLTAWLLWVVVLFWQLPHFYALSLYRKSDYAKSGLPMMSVVKPRELVMKHISVTAVLYVVSVIALLLSPLAVVPVALMSVAALLWLFVIRYAGNRGSDLWTRKVFGTSLYLPIVMVAAGVIAVALT